ncbi:hypothetical protein [Prauserella muralis]|uniref:Uncharacterized protein n=1 Tax=Prauserella muralis TaxID=588067 RepID=A0A2V4AM64_9PSEU|nr:hypothetical protein [Prauserella muralis]PXY21123.1 hypothetical protein BAY60_27030 [Prauserella muralis]TWE30210.1 hypothetical protein FHX69_2907 [Prauserella muralis]
MAFTHGKNSKFLIEDNGATERDLSQYIDNVPAAVARAMAEVTAFGDDGVKQIPGLENSSWDISGHFDATATTGPHAVLSGLFKKEDATVTFTYGPAGNATGNPRLTGECWISNYTITSAVGDKVSFSATVQVDGVVTFDSFP